MATLSSAEQAALLWPIKAKGAVVRVRPLNDPSISKFYQNSMEQGRYLESSIADANNWLLQKKTLLNEYVISYTHMNQLAVDGQLGDHARRIKYIADSISILQTAKRLAQEIVALNNAVTGNITQILAIVQSLEAMVQTANNSLANLLNNICNWGIPGLPSIPNLFPDSIWNWNGYSFTPLQLFAALKSNTNFNFNFSFKDCSFGPTATSNLFVTDPLSTETYSGLVFGSANFIPPLNGVIVPAAQDLNDPAFISTMQGLTTTPYYSPAFNPNSNMLGATPDPHYIISDYQMPAATYVADIVSIAPQLRSNTVFLTDPDYSNPNLAQRTPVLQKALIHSVNIAQIVAANYDPFLVSAWLIYLNLTREARGGVWIPNFQAIYDQFLQSSIGPLLTQTVPWNNVLPSTTNFLWQGPWDNEQSYFVGDIVVLTGKNYVAIEANTSLEPDLNPAQWSVVPAGTVYTNTPTIEFITTIQALSPAQQNHLLWQLSYIEAALLGYTRNSNFDAFQDVNYLNGPTGNSLDYQPTILTASQVSLILGQGVAEFPVPITFPSVMKTNLDAVITIATVHIQNDVNYLSPRLANRYTYDQFAQATPVDRFSQFWRDFATNLTNFLAQDPYLVQFAITYPEILDGALDPLATSTNTSAYQALLQDVASRNRSWLPGTPLLNIPTQPITGLSNSSSPNVNNNGWTNPPTDLDPNAFLARPDIQVLPIPVQIAMLRTNLSYAGVNKWAAQMNANAQDQIAIANSILAATNQIGFQVQITVNTVTGASSDGTTLKVLVTNAYLPGDLVLLQGMVESALNNQIVTVIAASATQFTCTDPVATPFSNPTDTGTTGLVTNVPAASNTQVNFDTIVFDFTNNVTTLRPGLFTIQAAGNYTGFGQLVFEDTSSGDGVYSVVVTQNGTPISSASSDPTFAAPQTVMFSFIQTFAQGDTVEVLATHNFSSTQVVNGTSFFSMTQSQIATPSTGPTSGNDTNTYNLSNPLPAWYVPTTVPAGTAVFIQADGTAAPIDPFTPSITNIAISGTPGAYVVVVTAAANHFAVNDLVVFAGVGTADFLNSVTGTVTSISPLTIAMNAALSIPGWATIPYTAADSGTVLRAINSSGAILAPFADGITTSAATAGQPVEVATNYGEIFSGTGLTFAPGGLLYAGLNGLVTQDYASLTTGTPTASIGPVGWIIMLGRADTGSSFIFEPNIPTRTTIL